MQWRERRRGFFTDLESEMLLLGAAFSRSQTGWLRQSLWLAERRRPIIAREDIDRIGGDWGGSCERVDRQALAMSKEIERVARVHWDPFAHSASSRSREPCRRVSQDHGRDSAPFAGREALSLGGRRSGPCERGLRHALDPHLKL